MQILNFVTVLGNFWSFVKNSLGTLGTFSHVLKTLLSRGYYLSPIFLLPFTATHKKAANRFSGLPLYRFI